MTTSRYHLWFGNALPHSPLRAAKTAPRCNGRTRRALLCFRLPLRDVFASLLLLTRTGRQLSDWVKEKLLIPFPAF